MGQTSLLLDGQDVLFLHDTIITYIITTMSIEFIELA